MPAGGRLAGKGGLAGGGYYTSEFSRHFLVGTCDSFQFLDPQIDPTKTLMKR
jgi:hypothetical protein